MESEGYDRVCKVTAYHHFPFDNYHSQPVLLLDEFNSSLPINDMNNYLDGYPLELFARYSHRQACYTKVYIVSNLYLEEQYPAVQKEHPDIFKAFLRRIHKVMIFNADGTYQEYDTKEYLKSPLNPYKTRKRQVNQYPLTSNVYHSNQGY